MKICSKCGAQLSDNLEFCTKCGSLLTGAGSGEVDFFDFLNEGNSYQTPNFQNQSQNRQQSVQPRTDTYAMPEQPNYGEKAREIGSQFMSVTKKAAGVAADAVKTGVNQVKTTSAQNAAAYRADQNRKLVFAEGETLIRSYQVIRGRTPGKLVVTNKRIIFTASSSNSKAFMSTPIDSVGAIDIVTGRNFGMFFLGVLLCILIVTLIWGVILIEKSKSMCIQISATNSSPGLVLGQPFTSGKATEAIMGDPGPDVGIVMAELGAMILDLQQFGDNAIEKWKK